MSSQSMRGVRGGSLALLLTLPAALAACARAPHEAEPTPAGGADPAAAAETNRIELPPTVRRNLGITFARVEARRVAQTLRISGAFELRQLARHEYRMALPGRIQLLVDQFDPIEIGQPLFRFQSPAWPELLHEIILGEQEIETAIAEIEVVRAKTAEAARTLELVRERIAVLAQADFKRADLESEAAVLEASLPRLDAELHLAETRLENARRTREHALHRAATAAAIPESELEAVVLAGDRRVPAFMTIDWIEVRAVKPGVVESLAVTDGAFVEPPSMVLSTVDTDLVRFRAMALQADLPLLERAVRGQIVPPEAPGRPLGTPVPATTTLGLAAHPEERMIPLLATPDETAPWIRPGVSAFLEVVVDSTASPSLAVPRSAIVQDGLTHVFFRRDPADPNAVLRVEADLGIDDGRWVVLKSGVMRGDEVVLDGAYELNLASQRSGAAARGGHVHADGTFHADEQ